MAAPQLHLTQAGEGPPVVLLHGLTATHRYVVHGSRALERSGHHVIAYDARGHGASAAAADAQDYGYGALADDLLTVLDSLGIERAVLAGVSMGAHTMLRFALQEPARVAALAIITPAFDGGDPLGPAKAQGLARWDALADGLQHGGAEGFLAAYGDGGVGVAWRDATLAALRQRLALHEHPDAVADAIRSVARSRPFETVDDLAAIDVPTLVIADHDEADPGHPLAVGEAYARAISGAELVVEAPGESPIAWQGGRLSKLIANLAARAFERTP